MGRIARRIDIYQNAWAPHGRQIGCEGERHARAALMAFGCRRADQRAASRAEFRTHLFWLRPEHSGNLAAPAVEFVAPTDGKWHVVSLPGTFYMPIIAGIPRRRETRIVCADIGPFGQ